jgi:hypothetical protein
MDLVILFFYVLFGGVAATIFYVTRRKDGFFRMESFEDVMLLVAMSVSVGFIWPLLIVPFVVYRIEMGVAKGEEEK